MSASLENVTNVYALCGYVISAVFAFLATVSRSKINNARYRRLFYLASGLSVLALIGGLSLGWRELRKAPSETTLAPASVTNTNIRQDATDSKCSNIVSKEAKLACEDEETKSDKGAAGNH